VLTQHNVQVLVTGRATDDNGNYHDSTHSFDDGFSAT